ncbi:hypothetical protein LTR17_021849, partial [Elasticomyces elasticus]
SLRNTRLTDEVRGSVATQRNSIIAANNSTQTEVAVVQRTLAEVKSSPTDANADDECDELYSTVVNLEEVMEALTLSQTLLRELLSKTEAAETAKVAVDGGTTKNTSGTNYQGIQMDSNCGTTTWNGKE